MTLEITMILFNLLLKKKYIYKYIRATGRLIYNAIISRTFIKLFASADSRSDLW